MIAAVVAVSIVLGGIITLVVFMLAAIRERHITILSLLARHGRQSTIDIVDGSCGLLTPRSAAEWLRTMVEHGYVFRDGVTQAPDTYAATPLGMHRLAELTSLGHVETLVDLRRLHQVSASLAARISRAEDRASRN